MSVIVWDGRTLAADKAGNGSGYQFPVTKIRRLTNGGLFGCSGELSLGLQMYYWIEAGCNPVTFPAQQREEESWQPCLVIMPDARVLRYERSPYPFEIEDDEYAMGSGRDFALASMFHGFDAVSAVACAIKFDEHCGCGIDTLTLDGQEPHHE